MGKDEELLAAYLFPPPPARPPSSVRSLSTSLVKSSLEERALISLLQPSAEDKLGYYDYM
jgi:hypothetical protein